MKVVQDDDARSDNILDNDAADGDVDRLFTSEEMDHIEQEEDQNQYIGIRASLKTVFAWKNYRIYLATAWMFNAFTYLGNLFNLYLWSIVPSLVFIGAIGSITAIIGTFARFFGGYVGDTVNRKTLAVVSMFIIATYYLMIGIFTDPFLIFVALTIYASIEITKGGSTAYIMDNIPQEHSGFALSLFTAGRALSIITLAVFGILYPFMEFAAFRLLHLVGGMFLLVSTALRAVYLETSPQKGREAGSKLWKSFVEDNGRALKVLLSVIPGMIIVCIFDSISDSFFKLGALIYMQEDLNIDVPSMVIMIIITLMIQIPLLLKVGRLVDRKGVKSTALLVYSMMPVSAALLITASVYSDWAPEAFAIAANNYIPGLGIIFKTSFLAVVLKYVNDTLWYTIMLILIRKKLPRKDTSKILSLFWFIVWISASLGPYVGGLISEATSKVSLFVMVLILNLIILVSIARYDLVSKGQNSQTSEIST
ncbi:MAG: MFS transporter [Candidatus Thorarchaeota archaeon]|nr:MAG: MFS transporter [Candidatus Thorarchaeota archaeon]